jgi:hypothetical protein
MAHIFTAVNEINYLLFCCNMSQRMNQGSIHSQNIIACIWDFDKTLIPGYMQTPLFHMFDVDEESFWKEVNLLPGIYRSRGQHVSKDTIYLNHLLTYIKAGPLAGLSNSKLRECGRYLRFYPGLPSFFSYLKGLVANREEYQRCDISLEHYIISTGLAEIVRGSSIAEFVDGIFGCELLENPLPPGFAKQNELEIVTDPEISQIGTIVDNTIKTRYVFEINKGSNKHESIDVNANIQAEDRRIPIRNMIYVADGPSDVPVFSVVNKGGGKTYAVYNPEEPEEFKQNDTLLQAGRIQAYGPADYRSSSSTAMWLTMHISSLCDRIVMEREQMLASRVMKPPKHLHSKQSNPQNMGVPRQVEWIE